MGEFRCRDGRRPEMLFFSEDALGDGRDEPATLRWSLSAATDDRRGSLVAPISGLEVYCRWRIERLGVAAPIGHRAAPASCPPPGDRIFFFFFFFFSFFFFFFFSFFFIFFSDAFRIAAPAVFGRDISSPALELLNAGMNCAWESAMRNCRGHRGGGMPHRVPCLTAERRHCFPDPSATPACLRGGLL